MAGQSTIPETLHRNRPCVGPWTNPLVSRRRTAPDQILQCRDRTKRTGPNVHLRTLSTASDTLIDIGTLEVGNRMGAHPKETLILSKSMFFFIFICVFSS